MAWSKPWHVFARGVASGARFVIVAGWTPIRLMIRKGMVNLRKRSTTEQIDSTLGIGWLLVAGHPHLNPPQGR